MNREIPSIVLEVDEDGHKGYSDENEKYRQKVIESFNNRFIKVDIPRKSSLEVIEQNAKDIELKLSTLSKELIIDYSPELNEEDFINQLEALNIDKLFIKKFLTNTTGDPVFRYTHEEVGEFLEYSNKENYRHFTKSFTHSPSFIEGIDYKNGKNLGGAGKNKKLYHLTRATFIRICINAYRKPRAHQCAHYFAQVYDFAMEYVQKLRVKRIKLEGKDPKKSEEVIAKRIEEIVLYRISKYNIVKLENETLKEELERMKEENKELEKTNKVLKTSYKSVKENLDNIILECSKKDEKIERLSYRKTKYMNRCRTVVNVLE